MAIPMNERFLAQLDAAKARFETNLSGWELNLGRWQGGSRLQMDSLPRRLRRLHRAAGIRAGTVESVPADTVVLERILGQSDLVPVQFFETGLARARAVGRVLIGDSMGRVVGFGTGFLVSPRLLLTNNHVLEEAGSAAQSRIEFDFDGKTEEGTRFKLRPGEFFLTHEELDFTLVAVEPVNSGGVPLVRYGFLKLVESEGKVAAGEKLNIIQHPSGGIKQLAFRENDLITVLESFLHYKTDTAPGSSGSPLFSDSWEVVGLHHAGVPKKNRAGQILTIDGKVWREEMGESRIAWIANEGVRVSRVLAQVKAADLSEEAKRMRDELFSAVPPAPEAAAGAQPASRFEMTADGRITWSFPVEISIKVGAMLPVAAAEAPAPEPPPVIAKPKRDSAELDRALRLLKEAAATPYYSAKSDQAAATKYYGALKPGTDKKAFFRNLRDLLKATHTKELPYQPAVMLYPFVDLQPPGAGKNKVRSIYSGALYDAADFIQEDFRIEAMRAEITESLGIQGVSEQDLEDLNLLEALQPFNCEHVVPQSWFLKKNPMRGDLHHLFSCESGCNSFRGNTPYFDFPDFEEALRLDCGKREADKFEPGKGKGEVARATLYFLMRYPGHATAGGLGFAAGRIPMLLNWHKSNPPTLHEKHRNMAIHAAQGNRNPLIDHPEWAEKIDFALGLTSSPA